MKTYQHSIGKKKAIALSKSEWWKGMTHRDIAGFQLFTSELCLPFSIFHESLEKSLGRPVFTHELGLNFDGIVKEFLGWRGPPTFQQIIELIPEYKRLLLVIK